MTSNRRATGDLLGLAGATLLDRYEVESAIAQGGMAIIYKGRDTRLLRPVCIKVFHRLHQGEVGYRTAYEHFVQEAFALSQFSHPNTLRIYDFGYLEEETRAPFQISELLDGGTLMNLVKREGALAPDDVLEILEPVAGALSEAHARGIVHRDIKPSNILFGSAGAKRIVKLCDFGIAKVEGGGGATGDVPWAEDTTESAGMKLRLYSPGWAAPEQINGEPVGPPCDVFALGLVTGFMLLGRPIFPLTMPDAFVARAHADAHVEGVLAGFDLSPGLVDVIRRATRESIEERIKTVDELASGLRAATRTLKRAPSSSLELAPARPVAQGTPAPELTALPLPPPPELPPPPVTNRGGRLVLDPHGDEEVIVGGRRMRLVPMSGADQCDLGGDGPWLRSAARFRITITPSAGATPRINVKGLNCFVARQGSRPTTAVDIEADLDVDLFAPDRKQLDGVRCTLGRNSEGERLFDLGGVTLSVPAAAGAVLLDIGPGRELALLHRGTPLPRGKHGRVR
jgi:serine/threonine-protein kinase